MFLTLCCSSIVYPELNAKFGKIIAEGLFLALVCGLVSNVCAAYSVYFDIVMLSIVGAVFQAVLVIFIVCLFSRWMQTVAVKQNASFIRFDELSTDEYATLSYIAPLILSALVQLIYSFSSGDLSWSNRSQAGLLAHMAIIYTLHMTLIRKFNL